MNSSALPPPLPSALAIAAVAIIFLRVWGRKGRAIPYPLTWIPYLLSVLPFVLTAELPVGDSHTYYYPAFESFLGAVREGTFFPRWLAANGGVRIGFFHINLISTLPGRVFAYYLLSLLPLSAAVIYKIQYLAGVLLMGFGWWLALKQLTRCSLAAYLGTLMVIMGGTGITFHQEQVLGVTAYVPWFIYSLLKISDDHRYVFPAAILFGLGLTAYYPQINFLSMLLALAAIGIPFCRSIRHWRWWTGPGALLFLILAGLPSLYILHHSSEFTSSIRTERAVYFPENYSEYLRLNRAGGTTSALPTYFWQYLDPVVQSADIAGYGEMPDRCGFFVGRVALLFALFGVLLKPRTALPWLGLLAAFSGLTLGINCVIPIPKLLFSIRFPTFSLFRQWLHFFPLVNFSLSALAAIGLAGIVRLCRGRGRTIYLLTIILPLFLAVAELSAYDRKYVSEFRDGEHPGNMEENFFTRTDYAGVHWFQYKNRHRLYHTCPEAIPVESFLTADTVSVPGGEERELDEICALIAGGGTGTVIDTPLAGIFRPDRPPARGTVTTAVTPRGLDIRVSSPGPALLVTPLNYDLGARPVLDGEEARRIRINGALSGILVPEGGHQVEFIIPRDIYWPLVWIQWILCLLAAVFFLRGKQSRRR